MTRDGCCGDWPKPCDYHRGWEDGREALEEALRFYADGFHVGHRDSSDIRVDGDPYIRDDGDVARLALGQAVKWPLALRDYGWWFRRNPLVAAAAEPVIAAAEAELAASRAARADKVHHVAAG